MIRVILQDGALKLAMETSSKAANVSIADAGTYYAGNNVEAALQEIGAGTTLDSRYCVIANSLSDVDDLDARVNLGLVAGGAGDVWVEKMGDTMTRQLLIDIEFDELALIVRGHSSQTFNILEVQNDDEDIGLSVAANFDLALAAALHMAGDFTNYNDALPDMGKEEKSDKRGYGLSYISDKLLAYCKIGTDADDEEGAIRATEGGVFQIYLNGIWNDIVINFRLREDSDGAYEFEHRPVGFDLWYEIMSGNSDALGIDGRPLVQQYVASMGAYQPDIIVDGGSF